MSIDEDLAALSVTVRDGLSVHPASCLALIAEVRLLREALTNTLADLVLAAGPADADECFSSFTPSNALLGEARKLGEP